MKLFDPFDVSEKPGTTFLKISMIFVMLALTSVLALFLLTNPVILICVLGQWFFVLSSYYLRNL